jgi:asparagine synthase (glutamine-hydrolysing)
MCGIAGFIDLRRRTPADDLRGSAKKMADSLRHRGPDSGGVWVDEAAGIAVGHRRLAILDLSPAGNQPMVSSSGRFVIVYNGELYNFRELRRQLEQSSECPVAFRGQADTEVVLACFERWGVKASLPLFNGMFAFAVWDRQEHVLHLSRDRMGEKPIYYGWLGEMFLFGSELKALRAHPGFRSEINRDALILYMRHNCVPTPHSIYRGIYKLPPGNLLSLPGGNGPGVMPIPYWSLRESVARGRANPFPGTEEEAVNHLDALLRDAVRIRMIADVPLGAFLSGGVDSSAITALMQAQSSRPVKTFTIGLHDSAYDEAHDAAAVARHLGTEHRDFYVTSEDALSVIPKLPSMFDEPFADSSQIPTFLVSQMARQHVTVGLSGDGGDELFGGYNRHVWSDRIWNAVGWLPLSAKSFLASSIRRVTPQAWDKFLVLFSPFLPSKAKHRNPGLKLHKIADMLLVKDRRSLYLRHTSHWAEPSEIVNGGEEDEDLAAMQNLQEQLPNFVDQMMFLDAVTYLSDDILTKVDRASMAVSLEARVPLLDYRIVEFAWSLPSSMKFRGGEGKWILRQMLDRYISRKLMNRPKSGFAIPLGDWLRGPLRDWVEALIDENRLKREGFFHPGPIRKIWKSHLLGQSAWQYHLWDVLMFQAWLQESQERFTGELSVAMSGL